MLPLLSQGHIGLADDASWMCLPLSAYQRVATSLFGSTNNHLPCEERAYRGAESLSSLKSNNLFINKLLFLEGNFNLRKTTFHDIIF